MSFFDKTSRSTVSAAYARPCPASAGSKSSLKTTAFPTERMLCFSSGPTRKMSPDRSAADALPQVSETRPSGT